MPDVSSWACPTAAVTPQSQELVQIFARASWAHERGAALFGPDLSRWPARMVDALVVIEQEAAREESARAEE